MLLFIFFACIAACHAGLLVLSPSDFQKAGDINISSIVHNAPSAVSHTSFTRVHNTHHISNPRQHTQSASAAQPIGTTTTSTTTQAASIAVQSPVYGTAQPLHTIPAAVVKPASPAAVQVLGNIATAATATLKGDTPIIQSLTHTPAHLTFAARPVVYQTLPEIKPVRKISFDEFVPSPRKVEYKYIQ
ncbi:PREDICTED: uncharacterized protein LOC108359342 [Rhagoletis zephyria]|uniref:uncharacterized protein LOC108359342 n=1 Tax=Rhagoletis zephyria TaxID=28612 RepID=UPI00081135C2|nr:PREDICTED: uncharacterized protein LOC108359342 [Rhagoletis zephyria]